MRFPIRFTGANKAMVVLGLRPANSWVEVDGRAVRVRMGWMGWAFRAEAPRSSVRGAAADHGVVWGWGAHGWRHVWLVNGSSSGLVRIDLDPMARGRLLGVVPLRIRALRVAVEDPDALLAALSRPF